MTGQTGFAGLQRKVHERGITDVIFDLDGTLIDSAPGIIGTITAVFAAHGIEPARPIEHGIVGPPLEIMIAELLRPQDLAIKDSLIADYKQYYDREGYRQSRVFDGVNDVLSSLKAMGVDLHIATNKRIAPTVSILHHFDWTELFASVYAVDSHGTRFANKSAMLNTAIASQGIDRARVIYVGDTKSDEMAAAENRITYVQVSWGYEQT